MLLYTATAALIFWRLPWQSLAGALGKGLLLSFDIALIVFGAIFFLGYLRETGALHKMQESLKALSPDRRVQAILLTWLFGGFIEGVAGFGTPAVTVAPLLVGIGFAPLTAVTMALLANSTAVAFGAVGTPVRIGFAGLETLGVSWNAALLSLLPGLLVPLMILGFMVRAEVKRGLQWHAFRQAVPWALFAGAAFLLPFSLFAKFGPEFPSIFGGAIGLTLAVLSLRFGVLVPKPLSGEGSLGVKVKWISLIQAFFPYLVLMIFLLFGKLAFNLTVLRLDLGADLFHNVQLFSPGFAFLTTVALLSLWQKDNLLTLIKLGKSTLPPLLKTALSIFFISAVTYVMIVSGMLESLAQVTVSPALPFYSAFIGAFGAFLAGSATVSNLLFGALQSTAAEGLGLGVSWILALQLLGAGAGNMIALPNLLAVQAAVGLESEESRLISRLLLPCLLYLCVASLVSVLVFKSFK